MAKKKLRRPKPHPKFGASAASGKRNQEVRDLKNRIFELENDVESLHKLVEDRTTQRDRLERHLDATIRPPILEITEVLRSITLVTAAQLGIISPSLEILKWIKALELGGLKSQPPGYRFVTPPGPIQVVTGNKENG